MSVRDRPGPSSTSPSTRLRLGLFAPRFALFDAAMPPEFPVGRRAYAQDAAVTLAELGDVDFPGVIESLDDAHNVAERWAKDHPVDVIICWPTMAAPPGWLEVVLDQCPRRPVVVVAAQEFATVPDGYDTDQATERSLPVGAVMVTNVLRRRGVAFEVVVGRIGGELDAAVASAVNMMATIERVGRLRLGVIGAPIDGYSDVEVSSQQLSELGVTVVDVADELDAAFDSVAEDDIDRVVAELGELGEILAEDLVMRRSARLAVALEAVVADKGLDGGAVNCHGPRLRFGESIGITACAAVSRCTNLGQPFACTGDLPTAVALALGRSLAGAALYCELYQLDLVDDWLLVANGGEGDWNIRDRGRPLRFLAEDHYLGSHGPGVASAFSLPVGPATLISLSPGIGRAGRWGLVVAKGQIIGSAHEAMEGPNAMFRFSDMEVSEGYRQWCRAGATHHAALLPGHQSDALAVVSQHLGIDSIEVTAREGSVA